MVAGCAITTGSVCELNVPQPIDIELTESDLERLADAPESNIERARLAKEYLSAFCEPTVYPIRGSVFESYACAVEGKMKIRVLVGAHYDRKGKGFGVADNWTGVILTRALLAHYTQHPPDYTLEFVLFGEEEPGMLGSRSFLRQRSADEFGAMINIDTLGLDPLTVDTRSHNQLECLAHTTADSLGVEARSLNLHISTGDWEPFKRRGVPSLNLHSLDRRSYRIVHTARDQLDVVDTDRLKDAYRVILNVIENLHLVVSTEARIAERRGLEH